MQIITLDFETFWDRDYSLTKLTNEEYVRHKLFEIILVAVKVDEGEVEWFSGTKEEVKNWLRKFKIEENILLCHNTAFDGFILSQHFGILPKKYACTMSMAKILHGLTHSVSLRAISDLYYVGFKGDEAVKAMGRVRCAFFPDELDRYALYCMGDVNLTWMIFHAMVEKFPLDELNLIDLTIRMYCNPKLVVDELLLQTHLYRIKTKKEELLKSAEVNKDVVMSNDKFATMLRLQGVEPPRKISPTTKRLTWAFAKTDEEFKRLLDHPNFAVAALAAARLGNKSTLEETRAERFIGISTRGTFPFSVRYAGAAVTHRWSGFDVNPQNLPRGSTLRNALVAPDGFRLLVGDLSNIELRLGLWLAGEDDQLGFLRQGIDLYRKSAEEISGVPYDQVDKDLRFVFKTVNLAGIYGVGPLKMYLTLAQAGIEKPAKEVEKIVSTYRQLRPNLIQTWKNGEEVLRAIVKKQCMTFGRGGLLRTTDGGLLKPNGLSLPFPDLRRLNQGWLFTKLEHKSLVPEKTYGAKVFQRSVQSLARDVIGWQMLKINKRMPVVGTVHDEIICLVHEDEVEDGKRFMEFCMTQGPEWIGDCPIACTVGDGQRYGEAK